MHNTTRVCNCKLVHFTYIVRVLKLQIQLAVMEFGIYCSIPLIGTGQMEDL